MFALRGLSWLSQIAHLGCEKYCWEFVGNVGLGNWDLGFIDGC
jgi:hypothetical protein